VSAVIKGGQLAACYTAWPCCVLLHASFINVVLHLAWNVFTNLSPFSKKLSGVVTSLQSRQ